MCKSTKKGSVHHYLDLDLLDLDLDLRDLDLERDLLLREVRDLERERDLFFLFGDLDLLLRLSSEKVETECKT